MAVLFVVIWPERILQEIRGLEGYKNEPMNSGPYPQQRDKFDINCVLDSLLTLTVSMRHHFLKEVCKAHPMHLLDCPTLPVHVYDSNPFRFFP